MKQEYLLETKYLDNFKKLLSGFNFQFTEHKIPKTECSICNVATIKNTFSDAKALSLFLDEIHESDIEVLYVVDRAACYFSNKLYPKLWDFENKLRKIWVIAKIIESSFKTDDADNIMGYDLYELLNYLMIDNDNISKIKKDINNMSFPTVNKIKEHLETCKEDKSIMKDLYSGKSYDKFLDLANKIRNYRNEVMHCKPITYKKFLLVKKSISSVDFEISNILTELLNNNSANFDDVYKGIVNAMNSFSVFTKNINRIAETIGHAVTQYVNTATVPSIDYDKLAGLAKVDVSETALSNLASLVNTINISNDKKDIHYEKNENEN